MCFNPAKSWQLGWYSDKRIELNMDSRGPFEGRLVGVADYDDSNAADKYVNIKIENGDIDLFIGFNLDAEINSGTKEGQNKVTIQSQGSGYSPSSLVAELAANEVYVIQNYKGGDFDLVVEVNGINLNTNPPFADIAIYQPGCLPGDCGAACGSCCESSDCDLGPACAAATCESDGTCSYDTSSCDGYFVMTLKTDSYPAETTWQLVDDCDNGKVVMEGGPYSSPLTTYTEERELGESKYTLNVYDEYGDGMCCQFGQGSYSATMNSIVVGSGEEFNDMASSTFGRCGAGHFVMTVNTDKYPSETTWELVDDCDNGTVVMEGGPYSSALTTIIEESQIGLSQFTLNFHDEYGDGMCCNYGQGNFSATMDYEVVGSGEEFDDIVSSTFGAACTTQQPPQQTPQQTPPCPEDIILISQNGETEYPAIPIRILEQNVGTVIFEVVNTFDEQVDRIYTQYHKPPVGDMSCLETTFVDTDEVVEYTAYCLESDPITVVQVWVSDGSLDSKFNTAVVPDCCQPTPDDTNGKVQYTFQIRCVSECPEIAR
jgi:hypothetical protein